jgi:hypothetical protein
MDVDQHDAKISEFATMLTNGLDSNTHLTIRLLSQLAKNKQQHSKGNKHQSRAKWKFPSELTEKTPTQLYKNRPTGKTCQNHKAVLVASE